MDSDARNIFFLGLAVLFGWMAVVVLCAVSPQFFRDFFARHFGCCVDSERKKRAEKIALAKERMRSASLSFLVVSRDANALEQLAGPPSHILVQQALGPRPFIHDAIPEESRGTSVQPEDEESVA